MIICQMWASPFEHAIDNALLIHPLLLGGWNEVNHAGSKRVICLVDIEHLLRLGYSRSTARVSSHYRIVLLSLCL